MRLFLLIGLLGLLSCCKPKTTDIIKILPGKGIVYNNDSILFGKSTFQYIKNKFKITKEPGLTITVADGFDRETKSLVSSWDYGKTLEYKSLEFGFHSDKENGIFELNSIQIEKDNTIIGFINENLKLGSINPKIIDEFPIKGKYDRISKDKKTYELYSYGLVIELKKILFVKKINRILVMKIWE